MVTGASTRSGLRGADRTPAPPGTDTRVRKTVTKNKAESLLMFECLKVVLVV